MDETQAHTKLVDLVVRVQTQDDVDEERLRTEVARAIDEDYLGGDGDVTHVVTVQPLDLETATGRQALDRVLYGDPGEVRGTATTCWCGQPHDHGMTP